MRYLSLIHIFQFNWSEKDQTLTIGKRKGEFPGMLKERNFELVWVTEGHGIGVEPTVKVDKKVKYRGDEMVIRK